MVLVLGKLSVGLPYFNSVFVPLMVPLLILMGLGVHLHWQHDSLQEQGIKLTKVILMSLLLPPLLLILFAKAINGYSLLGLILAFWILLSTLKLLIKRVRQRGFSHLNQAFWGMVIAHCGVAATLLGFAYQPVMAGRMRLKWRRVISLGLLAILFLFSVNPL